MKKIKHLLISVTSLLLGSSLSMAQFNMQPASFDSSSAPLDGMVMGLQEEGFDLAWSNTNFAGGDSPGEIGGTFARTNNAWGHFWADNTIDDDGEVTRFDRLEMSGKFIIAENLNMDGWAVIGWTSLEIAETFPDVESQNQLGMAIIEPGDEQGFRVIAMSNTSAFERFRGSVVKIPAGVETEFHFLWEPSVFEDGTGTMTLTLTLEDGTVLVSSGEDVRIPEPADWNFDAFMIGGSPAASSDPARQARYYFDDLEYSVNRQVVDPGGGEKWEGYDVLPSGDADTGEWMGWVYVADAPYVYNYSLISWMYVPTGSATQSGGWVWIFN
ncbi:MAG: hypothetical protein AB3N64_06315 [Puniceicoccaceae bacterium]